MTTSRMRTTSSATAPATSRTNPSTFRAVNAGDDATDNAGRQRRLDDEELDSGDDEGRADRAGATQDMPAEDQTYDFMDADIARHAVPEPSDGELYLLKIPQFLAIEPTAFDPKSFQPPTTDHHLKTASANFSAFHTATTAIRWRRSPSDRTQLQSNARILRWSDGSLTLQHANDPLNQFEINANMLAPPQVNPKVPTPTSEFRKQKNRANKESYTYMVAPYEECSVLRIVNKFTTGLSVLPGANTKDAALEKLQSDMARAAARGRDSADQAISFIDVNEDPELRRQREEQSQKEKLKQQRAKEKHLQREQERSSRALNRGGRTGYGGGLDIDMLEGEAGGRRGGPKKPRAKGTRHQDWSDEDEGFRGRPNKEDDYDEDDDFIAASSEEPEIVEDDDDDDDGIVEEPRKARESPKRNRRVEEDGSDDEEVVVRAKKRRVVQDESDEEE
jgi:RNA polymerase-associated protein LEO1